VVSLQGEPGAPVGAASLRCEATSGFEHEYAGLLLPPAMGLLSHEAIRCRRPVMNLAASSYAASFDGRALSERHGQMLAEIKRRFGAMVAVPLLVEGKPYGAFVLYDSRAEPFSETELRLASALAEQSALAIQTARLREQVRQAAVAEERTRLARELHDAVTQSLYSMTLLAAGCRFQAEADGHAQEAEDFARLGEVAQQALGEMRLLIYELRPQVLETEGLVGAIQQRLEAVERRAGLRARLLVEDELELPPAVEDQLYRIVQEALNNVLKHAGARHVTVAMRGPADRGAPELELTVSDDGGGFNGGAPRGVGLESMGERAAAIGGSATITSAPGEGTTVTIRVPVRHEGEGVRCET
jgi:signal transduction histidine kinase